ncbi:MAG: global cell cycle regulator GcrA-like protein [Rhodospirillaceae bacterium]|jgi:GcrA cell cycle regulator|nr:global cell cycle regulator GcrA-like protein [Rhodospirillaceae bacterium]
MPDVWTDDRIAKLKKLWTEGLPTGEIGKRLGVSKNAVVGKAHRLSLKSRPSPIRRAVKKAEPKKEEVTVFTLANLTSMTCRWPNGDPKEDNFHFCGKPVFQTKPYCAEHCAAAYVGSNKNRGESAS